MYCFIYLITYKLFGIKRWSDFEQEGLLLSVWVVRFARFGFCDIPDVKTKDLPASWPPNIWRHTPLFIATPFSPSILLLQIIKRLYLCVSFWCSATLPTSFPRHPSQFCIPNVTVWNVYNPHLTKIVFVSGFCSDGLGPLTLIWKSQPGNTRTSLLGLSHMLLQFSITVIL